MTNLYSIPNEEFAVWRSSFALCKWINERFEEMESMGRFSELYFMRSAPASNVKKLIEEVVPISRLGLFLSQPGSTVRIRCFADNRNHDAEIEIRGFAARRFKMEVTTTESDCQFLRREALARYGSVPLMGPIRREEGEIVADGGMVDVEEEDRRCTSLMFERLKRKIESGKYSGDTGFLVFCTEFRHIDPHHRADLINHTRRYLLEVRANPPGVYYCYNADYSIDAVTL